MARTGNFLTERPFIFASGFTSFSALAINIVATPLATLPYSPLGVVKPM